ncbi:MAG: hypothetical protein A3F68_03805 [Acidobacteria bacterium RIFCSPLOWO2_12_FULL_54_10]|nr:MAG: hypothetical protein A3F68_03805 [Acidobacteria bacterium RIFCSPLOWO2_12_FULL_54_10]
MYEERRKGPQEPVQESSGGSSPQTSQTPPYLNQPGAVASSEAKPQVQDDFLEQIQESADRALSEAEQASFDIERLEIEFREQKSRAKRVWAGVAVLAVALIALSWYSYPLLQQRDTLLAQVPSLQESLAAVGERVGATEEQLRAWSGHWDTMGKRMGKLEKTVSSNLSLARKAAQEQASQVYQQLLTELDNRTEWMKVRLSRLESNDESHRVQLAQLQDEIATVRHQMTQQMAQARQETGREVAALNEQAETNRRALDALSEQFERRRVDFELDKNRNQEIMPEVALTVTGADVSYQRVNGWLWLVPDGRTLWVRGQGIQQPVIFYTQQDNRPYELVFTRVTENGAVGYLLVPDRAGSRAGGSFQSDTTQAAALVQ